MRKLVNTFAVFHHMLQTIQTLNATNSAEISATSVEVSIANMLRKAVKVFNCV